MKPRKPHLGYIFGNVKAFNISLWLHRNCFTQNFTLTAIDTTTISDIDTTIKRLIVISHRIGFGT